MSVAARAQPASPATKPPEAKFPPPIVFYVAKGELGACGPGCREWIAAEGAIDAAAEPRLWELLRKLGNDRKLPVYFHSPGGSVIAGFELGRLLRARGLTAGVGWTVPAECDQQKPDDPLCDQIKRSGRELAAELETRRGVCASSCVYTVLGGAVRDVGAGARLGIHDTSMPATIKSFDENGRIADVPMRLSAEKERSALEASQRAIAAYLKEMGISPNLLTAAHAISREKLHFLTREEIVAFGIDRREAVESAWSLADKSPDVSAVKLIEARDVEAGPFRTAMLSLSCRDKTTVRLQYVHEAGAGAESLPVGLRVIAGGRSFPLTHLGNIAQSGNRPRVENHGAELPLAALDEAAFVIETAQPSEGTADKAVRGPVRLAVAAGPALGALARRCNSDVRRAGGAPR
jgi:hypothetical protein